MSGGSVRRRMALGLAVLTASGMLSLASPAPAEAASTASAASACSGRKARTLTFSTGVVHIYRRNGYVCAVTVPKRPGARQWMSVSVKARGGRPVVDEGLFSKRAGPVTVHAGRRQVWVKGAVGRGSVSSGWIRC
ncbi:hypothetical protein ACKI1I_39550 [Streptomyces turgidiscabies]|uniref:hypothetical protein n=1 Tax=Streptomyces TaxID=1883 RepID=UPI0003151360|nr:MULTISPECIES: hypothetical protein [Streptomyces]MDX3497576.1 hypothetical protein [Streptomyces turgidiscabies]GAQ76132.1 hypothetical protein T45_07921 [Streptomyces turgidiscabies]